MCLFLHYINSVTCEPQKKFLLHHFWFFAIEVHPVWAKDILHGVKRYLFAIIDNFVTEQVDWISTLLKKFNKFRPFFLPVQPYKWYTNQVSISHVYARGWSRIFVDSFVTLAQWWRARHLRHLVIRRSPVRFRPKTRQLRFTWIWANRPSSKGFKLLFPVINAI